ncbi:hypothetical protein [Williamsia sp. M5A3_1d]
MQPPPAQPTAVEREQLTEFRRSLRLRARDVSSQIATARSQLDELTDDSVVEMRDEMYRLVRERDSVLDTLDRLDDIYPTFRDLVA